MPSPLMDLWGVGKLSGQDLGCGARSINGSGKWNEGGAGGHHARNMLEYIVCGNVVAI